MYATHTHSHTHTHTQNPRYKQYGFDVMTEDDKVFYPLATDSDDETEEWISVLTRAIGLEVEETDRVPGVCVCVCVCACVCVYVCVCVCMCVCHYIHILNSGEIS